MRTWVKKNHREEREVTPSKGKSMFAFDREGKGGDIWVAGGVLFFSLAS